MKNKQRLSSLFSLRLNRGEMRERESKKGRGKESEREGEGGYGFIFTAPKWVVLTLLCLELDLSLV